MLTLTLPITFAPSFGGAKNIYSWAGTATANSGWQPRGRWTVPGTGVTADWVSPNRSTGSTGPFTFQYTADSGASDFTTVWAWFSSTFISDNPVGGQLSCMVYYDKASNKLLLLDDAGQQWSAATPGTSTVLQNHQCSLPMSGASVSINGNTLTMTLPLTFTTQFGGVKSIYMDGVTASADSGWQPRGSWEVPGAGMTSNAVQHSVESGTRDTFTLIYSGGGAANLAQAWVWFNATFASSAASSCLAYYERATDKVFLINDAGTGWMSAARSSSAALQNRACTIALAGASVSPPQASEFTLTLPVTFSSEFSGAKFIYVDGVTAAGVEIGWRPRGKVTVAGDPVTVTTSQAPPFYPGVPITWAVNSSGSGAPFTYKWWIREGSAWTSPTGWTFSNTLTWTPAIEGSYSIAVWVRHAGNVSDTPERYATTTASISNAPPIVITAPSDRTDHEQDFVNTRIMATDPLGQPLTYSALGLPPEIGVDSATGVISGYLTADSGGYHTVIVRAASGTRVAESTFKWLVMCPPSDYLVEPLTRTVSSGNNVAYVRVWTSAGCKWTIYSESPFLTVTEPGVTTGNAEKQITFLNNDSTQARVGRVMAAGVGTIVHQRGTGGDDCHVTLGGVDPSTGHLRFTVGQGSQNVTVTPTHSYCPWFVAVEEGWVHVSPSSGVGPGQIAVSVDANPTTGGDRDATVAVNASEFVVSQDPTDRTCSLGLEDTDLEKPVEIQGETFNVYVKAPSGCGWGAEVTSGGSFIHINEWYPPENPAGDGHIRVKVDNNPAPAVQRDGTIEFRHGELSVTYTIHQAGAGGVVEEEISYYHTDALGSVRMVTNASGSVLQRYDYLPFGQDAIGTPTTDERRRFTGQERDREASLDYFGARYYWPQTGRFTVPDDPRYSNPFQPQSINLYAYAHDNPLTMVDPTGHDGECPETGMNADSGRCNPRKPQVWPPVTAWLLGWEWLTGTGPRVRRLTDGDPITEQLKQHSHIQQVVTAACGGEIDPSGRRPYNLSGFQGVPKYLRDYSTLATGGFTGNLAVTYLGSYDLAYSLREGVVNITITNASTIASGSRPPVIGYTKVWDDFVAEPLNRALSSGPMSKTTQTFNFSIPCR